jgi:fatty acid desaturase
MTSLEGFDVAHVSPARSRRSAIEWPTLALIGVVYIGWALLTYFHASLPTLLIIVVGGPLMTLHSSLQHEIMHGHPTKWRRVNRWLATPPLSLWIPYESYRVSHLMHHRDDRLTDPLDDPESYYWMPEDWGRLDGVRRALVTIQTTLAGRVVLGPPWIVYRYWRCQIRAILRGDRVICRIWAEHAMHLLPVLAWLIFVAKLDLVAYVAMFVYPGTAILLVRSFAEHRASFGVTERTAIVENAPILGFLFLYNSLHSAHHTVPGLPWYDLPGWYRENRSRLIRQNGGLVYDGYLDVARRYLFKPHDQVEHPFSRAP